MKTAHRLLLQALLCLGIAIVSCKKENVNPETTPPEESNSTTGIGTPDGPITSKTIGVTGGQLTSADGNITILVPAGALAHDTLVSIQPITNKLPSGIGKAYRLLPHGQIFSKPVSLRFKYAAADLENTIAEALYVAYQDAKGSWKALMKSTLDKNNRQITVTTNHFSDWTRFKSMTLEPKEAQVEMNEQLELSLRTTFPYVDPDDDPNKEYEHVNTTPRELRADEIKGWSYSGEGILISRGSNAYYTAPDHEPAANPEAVSVTIDLHRKGQFILVSNITVIGGHGVDYLQVDEDYESPTNGGKCMLYLWGKFGNDPGAGKRSVKLNGETLSVNLWSDKIIRCAIDEYSFGAVEIIANNKTIARTVLRKFTGKFVYTRFHGGLLNSGSSNALKEVGEFEIIYRGFGSPCPSSVDKLFEIEGGLAQPSSANYTLSGSASVSTPPMDGCVLTSSVTIPASRRLEPLSPNSSNSQDGFRARTTETSVGINVTIELDIPDVARGVVVKRANSCGSSSFDPARTLGVSFEGFSYTVIPLEIVGADKLELRGTNELKSNRLSSGILIDAWDGTTPHYQTDGLIPATFRNY